MRNHISAVQPMDGMRRRNELVTDGMQMGIYRLHLFDENGALVSFDWLTDDTGQRHAWVAILPGGRIVEADAVRYNDAPFYYVRRPAQIEGQSYVDVYIHARLLPVERVSAQPAGSDKRMRYMYRIQGTDACFVTWDTGLEQLRSARMAGDAQAIAAQCADIAGNMQGPRDAWLL